MFAPSNFVHDWVTDRFERKFAPDVKAVVAPVFQKYFDRAEYREKLLNPELTNFAKSLFEKHNKKIDDCAVLILEENDGTFREWGFKCAVCFNGVNRYLILLEKTFFDRSSPEVLKAAVAHEVGHILFDHLVYRPVITDSVQKMQITSLVVGSILTTLAIKKFGPKYYSGFDSFSRSKQLGISGSLGYLSTVLALNIVNRLCVNTSLMAYLRSQEIEADSFAAKECGVESTVEMLKVFSELAPSFIGASWWNKLNCGYPTYEERIAAVNKLAV